MATLPEEKPHCVYVVVLNYRRADDTLACVTSLQRLAEYMAGKDNGTTVRVVVVDNASGDGSADVLRARQAELGFHLIESPTNGGYSAGNNLGIRYALEQEGDAEADYLWLLNNDTTVEPTALEHMLREAAKTGGIVGPLILYPDRRYQQVGTRVHWKTGSTRGIPETELADGMTLDSVSGASMLVSKGVFKRLGLLDESFFLYFEDVEFCLRARKANIPVTLALRARVYHQEGASTGRKSPTTQYYYHRNRLRALAMYADPREWLSINAYTTFRLFRSGIKAWLDPARKPNVDIERLAVGDFRKGVSGPCPHPL